jgi:hypothetical protein
MCDQPPGAASARTKELLQTVTLSVVLLVAGACGSPDPIPVGGHYEGTIETRQFGNLGLNTVTRVIEASADIALLDRDVSGSVEFLGFQDGDTFVEISGDFTVRGKLAGGSDEFELDLTSDYQGFRPCPFTLTGRVQFEYSEDRSALHMRGTVSGGVCVTDETWTLDLTNAAPQQPSTRRGIVEPE